MILTFLAGLVLGVLVGIRWTNWATLQLPVFSRASVNSQTTKA